jgi:hypothetical protein
MISRLGLLGSAEAVGLQVSLDATAGKLAGLDRMRDRQPPGPVDLGVPVIRDPR